MLNPYLAAIVNRRRTWGFGRTGTLGAFGDDFETSIWDNGDGGVGANGVPILLAAPPVGSATPALNNFVGPPAPNSTQVSTNTLAANAGQFLASAVQTYFNNRSTGGAVMAPVAAPSTILTPTNIAIFAALGLGAVMLMKKKRAA